MNSSTLHSPKRSPWRNPFGIALVAYCLVMALVGLLVPDDILQANAWARDFSDLMASIVPQIDRITALNIKPDVSRFYFSVLWAGNPILFFISLLLVWDGRHHGYAMWRMPLFKAIGLMGLFVALVVCAQWMYWMEDVTNRQLRLLLGNTLGRSFWASSVYVFGSALSGAGFIVLFFRLDHRVHTRQYEGGSAMTESKTNRRLSKKVGEMDEALPINSIITPSWGSPLVVMQSIYFLLMAGAGFCIQDNVLAANAWARDFSDFMAAIVPQIDHITALNIEPDVNRFYFSTLWATSPALFGMLLVHVYRRRSALETVWDASLLRVLLSMCGLALMFAWTQCLWLVEPSMQLSGFLFGTSIGRSFFAQLVFYIAAVFCLAGLMVWSVGWIGGYIPRSIKEQHDE